MKNNYYSKNMFIFKDRSSYSEAEHAAGVERELLDALAREARLKTRLQSLAGSLEAAAKSSEERNIQAQNAMLELKETNMYEIWYLYLKLNM